MPINLPTPVQEIHLPVFSEKQIRVFIKRDDLIHPYISGNKWRKLKYILEDAQQHNKTHLVTFGGAFSNHLLATASAGKELGFETTGFVRGDELKPSDNRSLIFCRELGMNLIFVARQEYRNKEKLFTAYFGSDKNAYFIPEGGSSPLALRGVAELTDELTNAPGDMLVGELGDELGDELVGEPVEPYSHIFCACGTGATLAGIAMGLHQKKLETKAEGIAVLKGGSFLNDDITDFIPDLSNWKVHTDFHLGGYGKVTPGFLQWLNEFEQQTSIRLDPIYTGKMMNALLNLACQDYFQINSKILAIHTGGLIGGWAKYQ